MIAGKPTYLTLRRHALSACVFLGVLVGVGLGKQEEQNVWQVQENLVSRLSREWYNIGLLESELENVSDVLGDIRNLELFPPKVTHLRDDELLLFDASIEGLEKRRKEIRTEVDALKGPLADAIGILREMVAGEPVPEMFEVVEQGDVSRLSTMIEIKNQLSRLWNDVDQLLSEAMRDMHLAGSAFQAEEGRIEQEFFDIVRANLGLQSEMYYDKLNLIKDSLVARGNQSQIETMYKLELHRIKQYLNKKKGSLAAKKIIHLTDRYAGANRHHELMMLLARAHFIANDYRQALDALEDVSGAGTAASEHPLVRIQSLYKLGDYESVWKWARNADLDGLPGASRNLLIWIAIESALRMNRDVEFVPRLAARADKSSPYLLHVLHALARSFVVRNDWPTVISVLDRALRLEPRNEKEDRVYQRIRLTRAQTLYQMEEYNGALKQFFDLLDTEDAFEESLFGIVWCYLRQGRYSKAETTLRKLINQSPNSPRAADAILVLAKRTLKKAEYEWQKTSFFSQEEVRLATTIAKLRARRWKGSKAVVDSALTASIQQLTSMVQQLRAEKRVAPQRVGDIFDRAMGMCEIVQEYYEAGSFHEVTFTQDREVLLHRLDSLLTAIQPGASDEDALNAFRSIDHIKKTVEASRMLSFDILLSRHRWQKEYFAMQKETINRKRQTLRESLAEAADTKRLVIEKQLRQTDNRMDSLLNEEDRLTEEFERHIVTRGRKLVRSSIAKHDRAYAHYHLAEILYARENADFRKAFATYERTLFEYDSLMNAFRDGQILKMPEEPQRPRLDHTQSIRHLTRALELDPAPELAPAVRYSLAWCYSDIGKLNDAVAEMKVVAESYPSSKFAPQAWMYLGEHAFDNSNLDRAATAYQNVMKYPESQWFDEALYKYAWTNYRLSNPKKAISSFLALVDLGKAHAGGKALLENESMDYIAISFSEADLTGEKGLARATAFVRRFGDTEKGFRILHRLANVYREQGRYELSEQSFQRLLRLFPRHPKNPVAEKDLLAVKERRQNSTEILEEKISYFRKYNRTSLWAQMQQDTSALATGDSLASAVLYDAAVGMHQQALQSNKSSLYAEAAAIYEQFIAVYPQSSHANECHYNLAEILFSIGNYQQAAEEYIAVSRRYPNSKYQETAAWNAIVASQNLLKQEKETQPQ